MIIRTQFIGDLTSTESEGCRRLTVLLTITDYYESTTSDCSCKLQLHVGGAFWISFRKVGVPHGQSALNIPPPFPTTDNNYECTAEKRREIDVRMTIFERVELIPWLLN